MPVGRQGKIVIFIVRGATVAGFLLFWVLVMIFSRTQLAGHLSLILWYLIFAVSFLGITALAISLNTVKIGWGSFAWYLVVTAIPLVVVLA
jgi:hypothetical protein